jgi:hypothetical protein
MKNKITIMGIILATGLTSFIAGTKFEASKRNSTITNQINPSRNGRNLNRLSQNENNMIRAQIISRDEASITVKLADGSTKIILLSEKTLIEKTSQATKADIKNNDQALILGKTNSDGSITAQSIQLNPAPRGSQNFPTPNP